MPIIIDSKENLGYLFKEIASSGFTLLAMTGNSSLRGRRARQSLSVIRVDCRVGFHSPRNDGKFVIASPKGAAIS